MPTHGEFRQALNAARNANVAILYDAKTSAQLGETQTFHDAKTTARSLTNYR
jgi:hypothetical protein